MSQTAALSRRFVDCLASWQANLSSKQAAYCSTQEDVTASEMLSPFAPFDTSEIMLYGLQCILSLIFSCILVYIRIVECTEENERWRNHFAERWQGASNISRATGVDKPDSLTNTSSIISLF